MIRTQGMVADKYIVNGGLMQKTRKPQTTQTTQTPSSQRYFPLKWPSRCRDRNLRLGCIFMERSGPEWVTGPAKPYYDRWFYPSAGGTSIHQIGQLPQVPLRCCDSTPPVLSSCVLFERQHLVLGRSWPPRRCWPGLFPELRCSKPQFVGVLRLAFSPPSFLSSFFPSFFAESPPSPCLC